MLEHGRAPQTPTALIENGSSDAERRFTGTLGDLAGLVKRENINGPTIIIIGETAAFSARLPQRQEQFA